MKGLHGERQAVRRCLRLWRSVSGGTQVVRPAGGPGLWRDGCPRQGKLVEPVLKEIISLKDT
ncbi:hypothetical protein, partial [Prevotella sp. KH2C16]